MRLTDVITPGSIRLQQPCRTFEIVVDDLVDALVASGRLPGSLRAAALKAVRDREMMASTAIVEIGVSVPHARLAGLQGVVGAFATSSTALYYAMAGVPISIVALVLSAPDRAAEHLNVLASLSMGLQSETVRHGLQNATDPEAALTILRPERGVGR